MLLIYVKFHSELCASLFRLTSSDRLTGKCFCFFFGSEDGDTSNDFELARLLQAQFDAEAESERKDAPGEFQKRRR